MEREEEGGEVEGLALEAVDSGFFEGDAVGKLGFGALVEAEEEEVAGAVGDFGEGVVVDWGGGVD